MKQKINTILSTNKKYYLLILLVLLFAVPFMTENSYILNLFILTFIAIVLGMSFSMIYSTGLITLGAAAFYAVGAYSSAVLTLKAGFNFWTALPVTILITAVTSLIIGMIFIRTRTLVFVVLTLISALTFYQLVGGVQFLGGWGGFISLPRPTPLPVPFGEPIQFVGRVPFYYLGLTLLCIIALAFYAIYASRIGRAFKVIKQSSRLAQSIGVNIYFYRVMAFVIASTASGIAGSFYAHYFQVVVPDMFGGFTSVYIQVYSALGGLEYYIFGPAIGAAIMIFLPQLLSVTREIQPIIFGVILLVIIIGFPGGILGTLQKANLTNIYYKLKRGFRRSAQKSIEPSD